MFQSEGDETYFVPVGALVGTNREALGQGRCAGDASVEATASLPIAPTDARASADFAALK